MSQPTATAERVGNVMEYSNPASFPPEICAEFGPGV
jgi:hypothetical protein